MSTDKTGSDLDHLSNTFGNERVTEAERRALVTSLFDKIAPRYDLMNDLMSFGLHRLWKRQVIAEAVKQARKTEGTIIDLAGGTGDIALGIQELVPGRDIVIVDASSGMLEMAAKRSKGSLKLVHAQGESIPMESASASVVTLVFGLRNMTGPSSALKECARILKPGGKLFLLEFSKAQTWFQPLYAIHSNFLIPALGTLIARDKRAYSYLVESIKLFPGKQDISQELESAGLKVRSVRSFMFGVAAFHIAEKT